MSDPVLHLIAGPNGAGKSTLYDLVLLPITNLPLVNADIIANTRWPNNVSEHAYEAAELADEERSRLIDERKSFVSETVFSHESKVELLRYAAERSYLITLHIVMIPEDLAVARVQNRVENGGHGALEDKIRARFHRLWKLLAQAVPLVDEAVLNDNSKADTPFRNVARFRDGYLLNPPQWPTWAPEALRLAGRE